MLTKSLSPHPLLSPYPFLSHLSRPLPHWFSLISHQRNGPWPISSTGRPLTCMRQCSETGESQNPGPRTSGFLAVAASEERFVWNLQPPWSSTVIWPIWVILWRINGTMVLPSLPRAWSTLWMLVVHQKTCWRKITTGPATLNRDFSVIGHHSEMKFLQAYLSFRKLRNGI